MSSFSSVIRKPGAKVAPRVAPRRTIIRKTADAQQDLHNDQQSSVNNPDVETTQVDSVIARTTEPIVISDDQEAVRPYEATGAQCLIPTDNNEAEQEISRPSTVPRLAHGTDLHQDESIANREPRNQVQTATPDLDPNIDPILLGDTTTDTLQATIARVAARNRNRGKNTPAKETTTQRNNASLVTPPLTQASPSPTRERRESQSATRAVSVTSHRSEAEEALNRINSQFLRVGSIATAIIRSTPVPEEAVQQSEDGSQESSRGTKRRKRNDRQPMSIEEQAAEVVANAMGSSRSSRRKRKHLTAQDREEYTIEAETTTLADLCKDTYRFGQTSEVEKQMAANWQEILARRKEDAAERLAKSQEGRRKKDRIQLPDLPTGEGDMGAVPELVIENGQLVVASRDIDRHAETTTAANAVTEAEIREDTDIYKRVNSSTVGPQRSTIPRGQRWDDMSTELFYQGLKMFGTDFKMISNMIPGKNRRQVKLKFNVEEKMNLSKVQRHLGQKEVVELTDYASMTGIEFGSVADVYKQMEEDEKKLREEDETRRREEGIISQGNPSGDAQADIPVPSIETQEGEAIITDGQVAGSDRQSTAAASRLGSTTTGRDTAQPAGKKKPTRKAQAKTKKGRQAANKTKGFEGVEERLGDVSEVGIPGT